MQYVPAVREIILRAYVITHLNIAESLVENRTHVQIFGTWQAIEHTFRKQLQSCLVLTKAVVEYLRKRDVAGATMSGFDKSCKRILTDKGRLILVHSYNKISCDLRHK